MALLTLSFRQAARFPVNGYRVRYRPTGTSVYTTLFPNPTSSPVTIDVADNLAYEGDVMADCGDGTGSTVLEWITSDGILLNMSVSEREVTEDGMNVRINWRTYTHNGKPAPETITATQSESVNGETAVAITGSMHYQYAHESFQAAIYARPAAGQPTTQITRRITNIQTGPASLGLIPWATAEIPALNSGMVAVLGLYSARYNDYLEACAATTAPLLHTFYTARGILVTGEPVYTDQAGTSLLADGAYRFERGGALQLAGGVVQYPLAYCG
jgi:hypothetical protein